MRKIMLETLSYVVDKTWLNYYGVAVSFIVAYLRAWHQKMHFPESQ